MPDCGCRTLGAVSGVMLDDTPAGRVVQAPVAAHRLTAPARGQNPHPTQSATVGKLTERSQTGRSTWHPCCLGVPGMSVPTPDTSQS